MVTILWAVWSVVCLAFGFIAGNQWQRRYVFDEPPEPKRPRCEAVLGGLAMKRCELDAGHTGPHCCKYNGTTVWFRHDGDRIVPM